MTRAARLETLTEAARAMLAVDPLDRPVERVAAERALAEALAALDCEEA
jgi:hypothetical protein